MTREEAIKDLQRSIDLGLCPSKESRKMAIKALEKEPTYHPACIDCHKKMDEIRRAYDKLKEQEPVLDKIRVEIANLDNLNPTYLSDGRYTIDKTKVLRIIDKYKAEGSADEIPFDDACSGMSASDNIKVLEQEPCEDAISRQAVLDIIDSDWKYEGMEQYINDLPSVIPQPKTGYWIHFASGDDCSECGWSTGKYISPSKYCPNCGTKMIEAQESEE